MRRVCVALVLVTVVLAGCGSTGKADVPARSSSPSPSSPSPSPPDAVDGSDIGSCADGTCEVRVAHPVAITVPADTEVTSLRVASIDASEVQFTGASTGNGLMSTCGGRSCSFDGGNDSFRLTMGPNSTAIVNGLRITVEDISDGAAVVQLARS